MPHPFHPGVGGKNGCVRIVLLEKTIRSPCFKLMSLDVGFQVVARCSFVGRVPKEDLEVMEDLQAERMGNVEALKMHRSQDNRSREVTADACLG